LWVWSGFRPDNPLLSYLAWCVLVPTAWISALIYTFWPALSRVWAGLSFLKKLLSFVLGALLLIASTVSIIRFAPSHFKIRLEVRMLNDDDKEHSWVINGLGSPDCTKQMIDLMINVRLENLQQQPVLINDLVIEGETIQARWLELWRLRDPEGIFHSDKNMKTASQVDLLEQKLLNAPLQPHLPIRGWQFLQYQRMEGQAYYWDKLRAKIITDNGAETIEFKVPRSINSVERFDLQESVIRAIEPPIESPTEYLKLVLQCKTVWATHSAQLSRDGTLR